MDRFYDLLSASDVVVVCCPLTEETRGIFDRMAFEKMQNHALLVNVTRGKIMDEASLVEALETGQIAGAGLDVTPQEAIAGRSSVVAYAQCYYHTAYCGGVSQ